MRIIGLPAFSRVRSLVGRSAAGRVPMELPEFESLLHPLKDALYGFVSKSLGFAEEAGDVYQETVLRAFQYRHAFKRQHSFRQWIFAIAANEVRRHYRRRPDTLHLDRLEAVPADPSGDPGGKERLLSIFAAAAELTERQRRIFFLFYEVGFSIREIAGMIRCSENNVKITLNRCRKRIKTKLGVPHESV